MARKGAGGGPGGGFETAFVSAGLEGAAATGSAFAAPRSERTDGSEGALSLAAA
ncbi:MAG: hypothetical protein ACREQ4_05845 [Candidatus Binataceae bacterium]